MPVVVVLPFVPVTTSQVRGGEHAGAVEAEAQLNVADDLQARVLRGDEQR